MNIQPELTPVARLDFVCQGTYPPGWYIRYVVDGRAKSERLPIETGADAFGAVDLAASHLGCRVEEIAVGGPAWPKPLDGMVDEGETLEFVADLMPGLTDRVGEWRLLTGPLFQNDNEPPSPYKEPRRYDRREVDGVALVLPSQGTVLNWSEAGMGVEVYRPMRVSTRCVLETRGKKSRMELYGEVRWCRVVDGLPLASPALYRAGITLIG